MAAAKTKRFLSQSDENIWSNDENDETVKKKLFLQHSRSCQDVQTNKDTKLHNVSSLGASIDKIDKHTNKIKQELLKARSIIEILQNGYINEVRNRQVTEDESNTLENLLRLGQTCSDRREGFASLPDHIKGLCKQLEGAFHANYKELGRALGVSLTELNELSCHGTTTDDFTSFYWDVIDLWAKRKGKDARFTELLDAFEQCGVNPNTFKPMPKEHRQLIERNFSYLVTHLIPVVVLVHMRDTGYLSPVVVKYVTDAEVTTDIVTRLVDILPVLGENAFKTFVWALRQSAHGHVADRLEKHSHSIENIAVSPKVHFGFEGDKYLTNKLADIAIGSSLITQHGNVICETRRHVVLKGKIWGKEVSIKISTKNMSAKHELSDALLMRQFDHLKILQLKAVCLNKNPVWLITEPVQRTLLDLVKRDTGDMTYRNVHDIARQIAEAMVYLEKRCIVHGDLRAENVFVSYGMQMKVANFSVAAADKHPEEFDCWVAPEVHFSKCYSKKSDIWSFGVLLYEVITFGTTASSVITKKIDEIKSNEANNIKSPKPGSKIDYPEEYFKLMTSCWHYTSTMRPSFQETFAVFDGTSKKITIPLHNYPSPVSCDDITIHHNANLNQSMDSIQDDPIDSNNFSDEESDVQTQILVSDNKPKKKGRLASIISKLRGKKQTKNNYNFL